MSVHRQRHAAPPDDHLLPQWKYLCRSCVTEPGEKLNQTADGEIARAVAQQRGDVGLLDAEDFAG